MLREAKICKFINFETFKVGYLIALSSHCPYHWHLEMVKIKVMASMIYMLDKSKAGNLMPLAIEYLHLMLLNLGSL